MSKQTEMPEETFDTDAPVLENIEEDKKSLMNQNNSKLKMKNNSGNNLIGVFINCISTDKISLSVSNIGGNIINTLNKKLAKKIEGKCGENGYVKEGTTDIINYSNGVCKGSNVIFDVVYQCDVCNPVQGMVIECIVKNITKAGIRAEVDGFEKSPVVIFIARDHHYSVKEFSTINEGDQIKAQVIGQRFELNDTYVSVIAELYTKGMGKKQGGKQRISIME